MCLLQPTTPRQTGQTDRHKGSDVHGSSSTQRWVLYSIYSTSLYQFFFFLSRAHDIFPLLADCSKTFRVSLDGEQLQREVTQLHPLFIPMGQCSHRHKTHTHTHINTLLILYIQSSVWRWLPNYDSGFSVCVLLSPAKCLLVIYHNCRNAVLFWYVGYYILVYLQDHFLHCVNTRQEEMICHSLFFSGKTRTYKLQIVSKLKDGWRVTALFSTSPTAHISAVRVEM